MKLEMKLTRPAKSRGGDRYECQLVGEDRPLVIYFPQFISRPKGVPVGKVTMNLEVPNE